MPDLESSWASYNLFSKKDFSDFFSYFSFPLQIDFFAIKKVVFVINIRLWVNFEHSPITSSNVEIRLSLANFHLNTIFCYSKNDPVYLWLFCWRDVCQRCGSESRTSKIKIPPKSAIMDEISFLEKNIGDGLIWAQNP